MGTQPLVDKRIFLGANALFEDLDARDMEDLVAITHKQKFGAHEIVIQQNEPGENMYIIVRGTVTVRVHLADKEDVTMGQLAKGEAFGEIALFDHRPRTATVITNEPCQLLVIERSAFNSYLMSHPHVAIQLLSVMSKRLRATGDFLKDSLFSSVSSRIAETLNNIAHAYGQYTPKGLKVDIKFDDQELGEFAGVPGDVVNAQLKHWEKEGIIKISHGYLTLVKPDVLASLA